MLLWPQEKLVLEAGRTVTRKELSAAAREAAKALELRNGPRSVLSELVACWGEQEWERLLVWPSNDYWSAAQACPSGGSGKAFRVLIDQQLIIPKESPNGKRYAVKDLAGEIVDAFGFDLTPVYARRGEWAERLIEQKQAREARKRTFDEITIARRAAQEALRSLAEEYPDLDRSDLEERLQRAAGPDPVAQHEGHADRHSGRVESPEEGMRGSLLSSRQCRNSSAVTLITTTDLLVSLVTKAFRRKLRRFVKPNKPRSTYHRN